MLYSTGQASMFVFQNKKFEEGGLCVVTKGTMFVKQWEDKTCKLNFISKYFALNNQETHFTFKNSKKYSKKSFEFQNSDKNLMKKFRESFRMLIFDPKIQHLSNSEHNSNFSLQIGSVTCHKQKIRIK